ncbi:HDOD domain-containing protein [Pseudomonadota bacterium]
MGKDETLELIKQKIEKLGDLPVFTASVNQICKMSADPDADAMSLSQAVLKDANLSVKLLRLANSPYYNRGLGKISVVSRAVIMLGFETVKNLSLTMKFIEGFQSEHPLIDMDKLLVRAYVTFAFCATKNRNSTINNRRDQCSN